MPRDLDAVLDGMGWQLDDTERADMHKLQVATLLAWGVHPDSIGPTRKGRGYIAQAMADAQQQAATANAPAPVDAFLPRPAPPAAPALEGMPERYRPDGVRDRVEWRGGPCPVPLNSRVTVWTRGMPGDMGRPVLQTHLRAGMLHISKADGDKLAEALRLAKPGHVVQESAPPIAPQFDEAVKVLQAWGYSFTGGKWAPPQGAPFYVKRASVSRVRRGSPPATDVVLVASLDTVSIPGDWVAVYPGPAEAVRQATVEEVFLAEVLDEVLRARAKFPGDRVMGLALAEEFGELVKAVLDESPDRVRREAVQTAAMCVRLVLDGDGSVKEWRAARGLAPLVQPKEGAND